MPARKSTGSDVVPAVCAVFGSDGFLRAGAIRRITRRVLGEHLADMALAEFRGEDAQLAEVFDECRTASLLAPMRLVIVREADEFVTAHRASLEKYVGSPSPSAVLLLDCHRWAKTTRLYKMLAEGGGNVECEPPEVGRVPSWIVDHASGAYRCRIDATAARRLADLVGPQFGILDMELSKLATFVHPKAEIRTVDVDEIVGLSREEKVFAIVDAIAGDDAALALNLWDQVLATERGAEYRAVGGMAYAFRKLAAAKRLVASGSSVGQAAKAMRVWGGPQTLGRQLERFSLRQWEDHLRRLAAIDLGSKTGLGDVRSAVECLIVSLCRTAGTA
jgi:DNA polymerase III delta subunit